MQVMDTQNDHYNSPRKNAIEHYFPEFYFPDAYDPFNELHLQNYFLQALIMKRKKFARHGSGK